MTFGDKLRRFNWLLFAAMLALVAVGTVAIYAAGNARAERIFHTMWRANLGTAVLGLGLYALLAFTDYRRLLEWFSMPFYAFAVSLLIVVLLVGTSRYGGKRWLWFFQPSELSKLAIIAFLANVLPRLPRLSGFRDFCLASLLVGAPTLLILMEPDLGTALTLVPATVLMLFVARVWRTGLATILVAGTVAALSVLAAVHAAEKPGTDEERRAAILRWVPLKDHQVRRVKVFLFPNEDLRGDGYNLRQAMIAIGSGGFAGKGIGKGELNRLKYLPQSISINDFIFCVYAEETGFIGSLLLLALFSLLLLSGGWTAYRAEDASGRLLALGWSTLVFAHVFINIAMSIGLVPITGLPLPFISSGRTFLVTVMAGLGLVQSVSIYGRNS